YSTNLSGTIVTLAMGDLDRDGDIDIAATLEGPERIVILLSQSDGTFQQEAPPYFPGAGPALPNSLALGDLDGDSSLDLVVGNFEENTVSTLLGQSGQPGRFGNQTIHPVGDAPSSVAVGDFNGDGKLDIVATNYFGDDISVLSALATGCYSESRYVPGGDG